MDIDKYFKIKKWHDSSIGQSTVIQRLDKKRPKLSNLSQTQNRRRYINPISTWLFCLVVALGGGGGVENTPFHNSFVFKVRLLKFCTEILSDRMNNLR